MVALRQSNARWLVLFDVLFCLVGVGSITLGRWAGIVFPCRLDSDEAQMAANAIRILSFGWNWDAVDGTTSGPLNSLILLWPKIFGCDVTLSLARVTANGLLCVVFVLLYMSVKQISGRKFAATVSMSLALFYSTTREPAFMHYSSELLSLSLVFAGNYLILNDFLLCDGRKRGYLTQVLAGILVGAVFFAKLQAIPLAGILVLFNFYSIIASPRPEKGKLILFFLGSLSVPFLVFLGPLYLKGQLVHFYNSYIINAKLYLKQSTPLHSLHSLIANDPVLSKVFYFWCSTIILGFFALAFFGKAERRYAIIVYLFVLLCVSVYCIVKPGRGFPHYLMLSMPFFALFSGSLFLFPKHDIIHGNLAFLACFLLIGVSIFSDPPRREALSKRVLHYKTVLPFGVQWRCPKVYSWLGPQNSKGLVWGWMPEWYVWGGLVPASRETQNQPQIDTNALTEYFRSRLLKDFGESSPDLVVDAVAIGAWVYTYDEKQGIKSFTSLSEIIDTEYVLLSEGDFHRKKCPKLYLKRSVYTEYDARIVRIKSIAGLTPNITGGQENSLNNLNDYSVTEDSCIDYWLLPDRQLGSFKIAFKKPYSVDKIMILNTKNGCHLDRSTATIAYSLMMGERVVFSDRADLTPHPQWTSVSFPACLSDSVVIEVLAYNGVGGGLNEIKIFHSYDRR